MDGLLEIFGKHASEDKTRWKDSCWFVGLFGNT